MAGKCNGCAGGALMCGGTLMEAAVREVLEAAVWAQSRSLHGSSFEVGVTIVVRGVGGSSAVWEVEHGLHSLGRVGCRWTATL
jgi:hypothetical protein